MSAWLAAAAVGQQSVCLHQTNRASLVVGIEELLHTQATVVVFAVTLSCG